MVAVFSCQYALRTAATTRLGCQCNARLLELYLSTSFLDSLLQVLSLVLRETFLDCSRSAVYEILSFLQAKTASFLNCLYNLELSATNLSEDNVERCLLLSCCSTTCCRTSSYSYSCSSGLDAVLVLEDCCQLIYFLYCKIYQFFSNSFDICHFILNFNCF